MNKFQKDLEFGRYYEIEFMKNIEHDIFEQSADDKKFSDWDLKVLHGDKITTYEIKTDRQALRTKNICVEYQNRYGLKSGLSASRADIWVFMLLDDHSMGYHIYMIPRRELRDMINRQEFDKQITIRDSGNKCVLMSINRLKKYLYKIVK
jgi:hypothetical protein